MENSTLEQLWGMITEELQENKEPYAHINAVYEFNITDKENGLYQIAFSDGNATVYYSSEQKSDCSLEMKEEDFKKLLLGKLNSTMAVMTGKLKVNGNIRLALALENMLKQYNISS